MKWPAHRVALDQIGSTRLKEPRMVFTRRKIRNVCWSQSFRDKGKASARKSGRVSTPRCKEI